jgi:pimeloyl-ACP methyl ester carboxylesterase
MSRFRSGVLGGVCALLLLSGCSLLGRDDGATATPSPSTGSQSAGSASASPSASGSADPLAAFYDQKVRWEGCGGKFDCTTVTVPLDYSDPGGKTIKLDVVRLKAKDPQGSLLINPGGPGGSGVEYARAARAVLTPELVKAFDVVGFDPRGVVGSDPVDCVTDKQLDQLYAADGTPDSPAEEQQVARINEEFGVGCLKNSPDIAAHMGTADAARDMDVIRSVLGDEKLNYLGKSYGTFLGAEYAELFPTRVGRVVLDGVLPSSLDSDQITFGQAKAFDVELRRFVEDCLPREDCPLTGDVDQGVQQIVDLLARLDAKPLPGVGSRKLNESLATYAILSYLYFPPTDWEVLRYGLAAAMEGDGSVLMDMMDERIQRNPDGTYQNNGNEAFYAVSCLDRPAMGDAAHAAELAKEWAKDAPVFGPYLAWGNLPCWQWPLGPGNTPLAPISAKGSDPILVVSTKYDPATPYEWGVQVAKELDNATLLTYDADGHTAYTSGSKCVDNIVDEYFIQGKMPADGVVCKPDATK